jgi:hypothetical protein
MCDDNIEIGVTEITNNILVSAQPTDQIIDINVLEEVENVELTITPSVVEVNIDVTQELITEVVTVDANTCVNIVDVTVTDATDNVTLNITPSLVEVNINRGENNLNIEEYDTFADLPTIGDTDTYYITLDENKFWRWDPVDEVYVEISSADDRIPYLGAIKNANLGEWGMKAGWLGFDTTPTNTPTAVGTLSWNDTDGTADLILKGGNVTLQIGQEQVVRVVNKTGATLNEADFRAVRVRSVSEGGAQGQRLAVLLAMADSDADSATTIGIVTESISNNQEGFITTSGEVKKINTTGAKSYGGAETWTDGDILYLSPTHAGYLTNVKPQAPNHTVIIGWVVYAHANNGKIFVKVDNGYELDELHNVKITTPTNGQGLIYDSALGVWKNQAITTSLTATSPLSIASNVLSITKADATNDGYLSSADWNYFSAKQQPLSGTGFVKATGSVISYDNTVYTPQSRTLTINGTAYDLSADRSWTISVGSGMRNVSSFIATSGQTTFTIVGGYTAGLVDVFVNGARLNAGDYTATNGTTVVLGTGVVANDIVDIINYTASLTSGITGSGTANYIPKWSGSSNLTNSILFNSATGIGVNTTTPRAAFEVNGYAYSGGFWTTDDSTGGGFYIGNLNTGESYSYISGIGSVGSTSYIAFHTYAEEAMRIKANGYVGIGVSNPAYQLEVGGDINITGSFRINGVAIGGGSGTVTGTGTTNYIAKWSGSSAIGNSQIFDNGTNVGIGTASPSFKLDVNGIGNFSGNVQAKGFVGYRLDTGVGLEVNGGDLGNGTFIAKFNDYNNATKVVITGLGYVGIGTTSPAYKLSVLGNNASDMISWTDNINNTGYLGIRTGGVVWMNADNNLAFGTANSERMRISSSGQIFVGATSVASIEKFRIVGSSSYNGVVRIENNTNTVDVNHGILNLVNTVNYAVGNDAFLMFSAKDSAGTIHPRASIGARTSSELGADLVFNTRSNSAYTEKMRIDSLGNLGLGTTNSDFISSGDRVFTIQGIGTRSTINLQNSSTGTGGVAGSFRSYNGSTFMTTIDMIADGATNRGAFVFYTNFSGSIGERMRLNSSGQLMLNTASDAYGDGAKLLSYSAGKAASFLNLDGGGGYCAVVMRRTASNGGLTEHYVGGTYAGGISVSGSSSSYNTSSDYRLKEDLKPIKGLEKLSKINVYDFKWKASNDRMDGVLAHELQEVLPYAVTGVKDGEQIQGVDYSKIVPVLVQAIKELNAKLEAK